jgi:peptide deformylase
LVNPEIVRSSGAQTGLEGCLSIPGLQGEVTRADEVVIKGTTLNGKPVRIQAQGLLARIFQHELDHLNGKLFIDRADPETLHYPSEDDEDEVE